MGTPIYIAGATATGKSAVAIEIARKIKGQIISVDSMQVYKEMDIGTAKPSTQQRNEIPHHLVDCVGLEDTFDAARFVKEVGKKIGEIENPVFCGGTGLYFQAWTEGLGDAPPGNSKIREELEKTPKEKLLEELKKTDPETYKKIDKKNERRIWRAVEVIRITGKKHSEQKANWKKKAEEKFYILERPEEEQKERIIHRTEKMFEQGLVEETKQIQTKLEKNQTAQQALGYKQVLSYLRGEQKLPETVEQVKSLTWKYAKRQKKWFKQLQGTTKILIQKGEDPGVTARKILEASGKNT